MQFDTKEMWKIFFTIISMGFSLWPVFVIAPLGQAKRNRVFLMFFGWCLAFCLWLASVLTDSPFVFHIIPQPFNTILFFLTGFTLLAALIIKVIRYAR